jgi:hypothetical protein
MIAVTSLVREKIIVRPVSEAQLSALLEIYRQCEDFLSLGPVATASEEMVKADIKHSQENMGRFCGIFCRKEG